MSMSESLNGTLKCPWCKFEYLHHDRVTTYSRGEDEDADVRVVEVPGEDSTGEVCNRIHQVGAQVS